ncbi:MAG: DUF5615 family PIN-like protein, partial [Synechococcales cyanobacterium C42_A2020_086]|nr:DUF5615 family PIN-like protein [Synechococcales cyanobacterium C42_A2020_086]
MRFLLDQDVYAITARFLSDAGHDVVLVSQIGLSQASDEETRDRDYGNLVFVRAIGYGVLYLRVLPSTAHSVHDELARVIQSYSEKGLAGAFVVVEPYGHRLALLHERGVASGRGMVNF